MMPKPKTIWNHIIPLHYLRGFVIDGTNEVWINYKQTNPNPNLPASHRKSINNTGTSKNFYSDDVEQMLANKIENLAAPVIARIRKQILPPSDERLILATYITNFLSRVKYGKHKILSQMPKIYDSLFTEENLESLFKRKPSVEEFLKMLEIRKKWEGSDTKETEFW
jgi:hypothetical protein